jgi:hypothetical protein
MLLLSQGTAVIPPAPHSVEQKLATTALAANTGRFRVENISAATSIKRSSATQLTISSVWGCLWHRPREDPICRA